MKPRLVVVGSSGHAKVVLDAIEQQGRYEVAGLIDSFKPDGGTAFGYDVWGDERVLPDRVRAHGVEVGFIAIGENWAREMMARKVAAVVPGLTFATVIHPRAYVGRGVTVGRGTALLAGAVVNADSVVGDFCLLNTNSSLDHDGVMGDCSSLAPGAATGSHVRIGRLAAVFLGARVLEGRTIGDHTVIGAGAVVTRDIPDHCVAYGVPARVIRTRAEGDSSVRGAWRS